MAISFRNLTLPVVAAVAAWLTVPLEFWHEARPSLMTAFSVIAAAVMVRLARGLPFTNADHFEVDEIRQVTGAIKQIMRSLQALIGFILGTMIALTFVNRLQAMFIQYGLPVTSYISEHALSAVLAFCLVFVLVRIVQVVGGDYGLVELQSKFMIRAVERRKAKEYEAVRDKAAADEPPYKNPEGFGRLMQ